jgi:hypothetical protein
VVSIQALRARLPLIVFFLLFLLLVMVVGLACACLSDHPMQAIDRAVSAIPAAPPLIELWALMVLLLAPVSLFVAAPRRAQGRASPPLLQRFLF